MRNHSGVDEKRNNLRDPTLREKQDKPGKGSAQARGRQATTGMGSGERNSGQEGESR